MYTIFTTNNIDNTNGDKNNDMVYSGIYSYLYINLYHAFVVKFNIYSTVKCIIQFITFYGAKNFHECLLILLFVTYCFEANIKFIKYKK